MTRDLFRDRQRAWGGRFIFDWDGALRLQLDDLWWWRLDDDRRFLRLDRELLFGRWRGTHADLDAAIDALLFDAAFGDERFVATKPAGADF